MNPFIPKFYVSLTEEGVGREVHPLFQQGTLSLNKTREKDEMYYRTTIGGELTFKNDDYAFLMMRRPVDTFYVTIKNQAGLTIARCYFRYVDMAINHTERVVSTRLYVNDGYKKILNNLNTEYDLVKLGARASKVTRKICDYIQLACPATEVVENVYAAQSIPVNDSSEYDVLDLEGEGYTESNLLAAFGIEVGGASTMFTLNDRFRFPTRQSYDAGTTLMPAQDWTGASFALSNVYELGRLVIPSSQVTMQMYLQLWINRKEINLGENEFEYSETYSVVLTNVPKQIRTNTSDWAVLLAGDKLNTALADDGENHRLVELWASDISPYDASLIRPNLSMSVKIGRYKTALVMSRKIERNRLGLYRSTNESVHDYSYWHRYTRIYQLPLNSIVIGLNTTSEVTDYGVSNIDGATTYYYQKPNTQGDYEPIFKDEWANGISFWLDMGTNFGFRFNDVTEGCWYEIGEAIKAMLAQADPDIAFDTTPEYSEFLYGSGQYAFRNPLNNELTRLLIEQRSNANKPQADQCAQMCKTTLSGIFEFLKNVLGAYWFIEDNKLRIEHYSWFEREPSRVIDLSNYKDPYSKKSFAFDTDDFTYDTSKEFSKLEMRWAEETSSAFDFREVKIISDCYDDENKTESRSVSQFMADVEACAVVGKTMSNDGLIVAAAVYDNGDLVIPTLPYNGRLVSNAILCSGIVAHNYIGYRLPGSFYSYDGNVYRVVEPLPCRTNSVRFPLEVSDVTDGAESVVVITGVGAGKVLSCEKSLETGYQSVTLEYARQISEN